MKTPKKHLKVKGLEIQLPIFLPDATRAVTKSIDSCDLHHSGVRGAVINTYHLMHTPGTEVLKKFGGIKHFMNFDGLVVTDSGGWQVFSMIKRHGKSGKITDEGVVFTELGSKELFTPEKSINVQLDIGSDILICLDDFCDPKTDYAEHQSVVDRTIQWAKRCKQEFEIQKQMRNLATENTPLLFAVIQGGYHKELRKYCCEKLLEIGFDGLGYGGYVVDEVTGDLNLDISEYIANLIPDHYYRFALGVGRPKDIINLHKMGWEIFDCTLPTRDARHKRLYSDNNGAFEYIYINKVMYKDQIAPIALQCDCYTCKNYSAGYLHHLFKIGDTSAYRLATIHNLRVYTRLTESLM